MNRIKLIGLSGQLQNGKDTVAELIVELTSLYDDKYHYTYNIWTTVKFAGILKQMTALLIGCDLQQLEDNNFKNTPLGEEWRRWYYTHYKFVSAKTNPEGRVSPYFPSIAEATAYVEDLKKTINPEGIKLEEQILTPRLILQLLGTEGGRDVIHPNIWVNATLGKLRESDQVIVTDVRFPNEVEGIKKRDGIVVRVIRPDKVSTSTHPSETSLNDYNDWDYVIINDGTLDDLEKKVREMLVHFNIL